ncbi:thioredoxin family protein [Weeksellaceae bacterium TAE3-ERU29]|nr:thioredoxin family protein [Weeksellaceae bacterium TAE3-ERU29]
MNFKYLAPLVLLLILSCKNTRDLCSESPENKYKFLQEKINYITDLDEGLEKAKKSNKPIFLFFTGRYNVNSELFKCYILLNDEELLKKLKNNYINIWLFVDDLKNGKKWRELQREKYNTNDKYPPIIVILDSNGNATHDAILYEKPEDVKDLINEIKRQ